MFDFTSALLCILHILRCDFCAKLRLDKAAFLCSGRAAGKFPAKKFDTMHKLQLFTDFNATRLVKAKNKNATKLTFLKIEQLIFSETSNFLTANSPEKSSCNPIKKGVSYNHSRRETLASWIVQNPLDPTEGSRRRVTRETTLSSVHRRSQSESSFISQRPIQATLLHYISAGPDRKKLCLAYPPSGSKACLCLSGPAVFVFPRRPKTRKVKEPQTMKIDATKIVKQYLNTEQNRIEEKMLDQTEQGLTHKPIYDEFIEYRRHNAHYADQVLSDQVNVLLNNEATVAERTEIMRIICLYAAMELTATRIDAAAKKADAGLEKALAQMGKAIIDGDSAKAETAKLEIMAWQRAYNELKAAGGAV